MSIAPQGPRAIEPGHRLDRYELLCPIAEGGMASVWLARIEGKHGFERLVAVKTILPKFASDDQFEKMLLDEARIASRIEHMNVAQILDLGEHHEVLYLVLEWVEGESLSRLARAVKRKGLPFPHGILLRVLADTCGGLHAAHELRTQDGRLLGVVHRDVSPQNILVSTGGMAKLIDFGIAKAKDRLVGDTNAGVLKGKVRYMAPEQALGRPVDRRADLWAVGCILYRLLTGKAPFEGENDLASLNMLTAGRPPAPLPFSVHPAIVAIVNRALSFSSDGRYATAAEMQAAMEEAMQTAGIVTTTSGVAAFAAEHLAPYNERRQTSVKLAMAAAAERQRVRQLLQPMVNSDASTDVSRVGRHWADPTTVVDEPKTTRDPEPTTTRHVPRPLAPPRPAGQSEPPRSYRPLGHAEPPRSFRPLGQTEPPRSFRPTAQTDATLSTRTIGQTEPPATRVLAPPPDQRPAPLVPPPGALAAPRLPSLSEPPARANFASEPPSRRSYTSEPPASSIRLPFGGRPRRLSVIAASGAVTFLAVLVTLALVGRSRQMSANAAPAARTAQAVAAVAVPPTATASAGEPEPVAPPTAAPADAVPVVSANDLPKAQDPAPIVKWRSPSAPAPTAKEEPVPAAEPKAPVTATEKPAVTMAEAKPVAEPKPSAPVGETKPPVTATAPKPATSATRTRIDDGF